LWLPTTRQGKTNQGSHPGDQSVTSAGRLIIIENKGIENGDSVVLGKTKAAGGISQKEMLLDLQKLGRALMSNLVGWRGWVFFGMPTAQAPVGKDPWNGRDFLAYPATHRLFCPCQITFKSTSKLTAIAALPNLCGCSSTKSGNNQCCITQTCSGVKGQLDVSRIGEFAQHGQIGLPLNLNVLDTLSKVAQDGENLEEFLRHAPREFQTRIGDEPQTTDEPLNVLRLLANLGVARTHLVIAMVNTLAES
jgi:hypothetical protein